MRRVFLTVFCLLPVQAAVAQTKGLWTSAEELRQKPMVGPAWEAVWRDAHKDTSQPNVGQRMNPTNVRVLAAAIVYARTGATKHKDKVTTAIEKLVQQGRPGSNTLTWARRTGSYVLAADLIGYRTPEFERWLHHVAEKWRGKDGRTLRTMFETRPNNWGAHAFGALTAIYSYLGDDGKLRDIRRHWIQAVTGPNPGYRYGKDVSWHVDLQNLRWINPAGATKEGMNIDGFCPDDMRRGGAFQNPPQPTRYVWEGQQGLIMAARVLQRRGLPIWDVADKAIFRAAYALQIRLGGEWKAKGDDLWMLPFYDNAYGTNWAQGNDVWGAGKNVGWAYVLGNRAPSSDTGQAISDDFAAGRSCQDAVSPAAALAKTYEPNNIHQPKFRHVTGY